MSHEDIVGRAELKLKGAVEAFGYDFRGKTVLDIGSSTGGFTELALRMGAAKVIAVEKGTKQMKAPLRYDERVELHEKTDIFTVISEDASRRFSRPASTIAAVAESSRLASSLCSDSRASSRKEELVLPSLGLIRDSAEPPDDLEKHQDTSSRIIIPVPDVVLADVSFVSLRKILAHAKRILPRGVDYLVMLKPQFEAFPDQLVNGVVKNEKMRREIVRGFEQWLGRNGFRIVKKRDNEVRGKRGGNRERFYWLREG